MAIDRVEIEREVAKTMPIAKNLWLTEDVLYNVINKLGEFNPSSDSEDDWGKPKYIYKFDKDVHVWEKL